MNTTERIAEAKENARKLEALADAVEVILREVEERKSWYKEFDECGDEIPVSKMENEWNRNRLDALNKIEYAILKLL